MQDARRQNQDARRQTPDARTEAPDARRQTPDAMTYWAKRLGWQLSPTVPGVRPATAIVILVLLVVILIAGAFQLRAILTG